MANLFSTLITNRDATPKVLTDSFIAEGTLTGSYGYIFSGASDAAGTAYKLVSVPSNSRLVALGLTNTTLGNSSVIDIGVWYPTTVPVGGGAFLAASLGASIIGSSNFTTGMLGDTANVTPLEMIKTTNTRQGPNYQEMPLWQMLNLTADPECMLDIGVSVRVAVATAGYVGLRATFQY